jgi:rhodanese-related sulfurtransferase
MKVVIIGGVATGPKAAPRLRRLNPEAEITILERGKILSYAGCGMPYYVSGDVDDWRSLYATPAGYKKERIDDPRIQLIPLGMLRQRMNELPKDKEIITFCKFSLRGYEAQTILDGEGYKDVKFMDGGIEAWPYELASDVPSKQ